MFPTQDGRSCHRNRTNGGTLDDRRPVGPAPMLPINPVPLSPSTMLLLPPDATIKNHRVLTVARDGSLSDRLHLGLSGLTFARDVPDSGRSHLAWWPFGSATHSRDAYIGHLSHRRCLIASSCDIKEGLMNNEPALAPDCDCEFA